jgi:hypothetical protein
MQVAQSASFTYSGHTAYGIGYTAKHVITFIMCRVSFVVCHFKLNNIFITFATEIKLYESIVLR